MAITAHVQVFWFHRLRNLANAVIIAIISIFDIVLLIGKLLQHYSVSIKDFFM